MSNRWPSILLLSLLLCPLMEAGDVDPLEHSRLYTAADSSSGGGITGSISTPSAPIQQILAIPPGSPEKVYKGEVGTDGRSFRFTGLPMNRYDLVVIYDEVFYEGLQLQRGESTLSKNDRMQITDIIERSEPFFTIKVIHRMEGETGRGNNARAICTFIRDRESEMYAGPIIRTGFRRTFKLVILQQVGPGWQVVRTRDLYPLWVEPEGFRPRHEYRPALSGIRVTDQVKDIGSMGL